MSPSKDKPAVPKQIFFPPDMPEYTAATAEQELINTPPPYMDPANAKQMHKLQKQRTFSAGGQEPEHHCKHCGSRTPQVVIWPAPRPQEHIRPSNGAFIGYVLVIAIVIFLLFAACKYLP